MQIPWVWPRGILPKTQKRSNAPRAGHAFATNPLLSPWVALGLPGGRPLGMAADTRITERNGTVLFAHCVGCMAGQGECGLDILSVLFYIEAWNRINEKLTCTQVKCNWLSPTAVKEVPYAPIADIDFRSAKKLKRNLDETINNLTTSQADILMRWRRWRLPSQVKLNQ